MENSREEAPIVVARLGGQKMERDWRTRKVPCPVQDPLCIADHLESDYCMYQSVEVPVPEAAVGLGAVVETTGAAEHLERLVKPVTGRRANRRDKLVKSFSTPLLYPFIRGCNHQFVELQQPRHRNCETCWNAFFWNQNEMTENIARNVQEQGPEIVQAIHGKKFLQHFLRFAILLARYEQFKQTAGTECAAVEEEINESSGRHSMGERVRDEQGEQNGTGDGSRQHQATD